MPVVFIEWGEWGGGGRGTLGSAKWRKLRNIKLEEKGLGSDSSWSEHVVPQAGRQATNEILI